MEQLVIAAAVRTVYCQMCSSLRTLWLCWLNQTCQGLTIMVACWPNASRKTLKSLLSWSGADWSSVIWSDTQHFCDDGNQLFFFKAFIVALSIVGTSVTGAYFSVLLALMGWCCYMLACQQVGDGHNNVSLCWASKRLLKQDSEC